MAKFLGKLKDGRELYGAELQEVEVKGVSDNENMIEIIGSTEGVDRDGEVLAMEGWDLKNFKKNPVVLESHNYWEPAIGRARVQVKDKKLMFKIEFPPEGVHPRADLFKKLYKMGFMKASSVGFIPKNWELGDGDKTPRRTFTEQELLEISLVTVPSNPEALLQEKGIVDAKAEGKLSDVDFEQLTKWVQEIVATKGIAPEVIPDEVKAVAEPFENPQEKNDLTETPKSGENKSDGEIMDFKKLFEENREAFKSLVKEAVNEMLLEKSSDELKEVVKLVLKEINEERRTDEMVLGDAGGSPKATDGQLNVKDLTREAVREVFGK